MKDLFIKGDKDNWIKIISEPISDNGDICVITRDVENFTVKIIDVKYIEKLYDYIGQPIGGDIVEIEPTDSDLRAIEEAQNEDDECRRMNVIARNGNDGLHYEPVKLQ